MRALPAAAAWSLIYLGLGPAWLSGAPGNPADPDVDPDAGLSLLGTWGPQAGAAALTVLAAAGAGLAVAMVRTRWNLRLALPAALLGVVLAVVLPDFRLLAFLGYLPILPFLHLAGHGPELSTWWSWPMGNQLMLTLGGLAWTATAVQRPRLVSGRCAACGRVPAAPAWTAPGAAARWGRWATAVAVTVPLGYAVTRFAWALGIPLGVTRELLDELGGNVASGAGLATGAVVGAVLTLGLVQRWGEVFPRWVPGLRGRRVPVPVAVLPALGVAVAVTAAGLMFVRLTLSGDFAAEFPGGYADVAGWLPMMFWPLWGVALAAAAWAYALRRRQPCPTGCTGPTAVGAVGAVGGAAG